MLSSIPFVGTTCGELIEPPLVWRAAAGGGEAKRRLRSGDRPSTVFLQRTRPFCGEYTSLESRVDSYRVAREVFAQLGAAGTS
jgi:hypothetical protein